MACLLIVITCVNIVWRRAIRSIDRVVDSTVTIGIVGTSIHWVGMTREASHRCSSLVDRVIVGGDHSASPCLRRYPSSMHLVVRCAVDHKSCTTDADHQRNNDDD